MICSVPASKAPEFSSAHQHWKPGASSLPILVPNLTRTSAPDTLALGNRLTGNLTSQNDRFFIVVLTIKDQCILKARKCDIA